MPDFIYNGKVYYNPVQLVMEQIGGVWKMPILWRLKDQTLRYGDLRKIPHISDKMLTTQLRELEKDGYIIRKVYPVVPPKTEYSLTPRGQEIIPLINQIREYGLELMKRAENEKSAFGDLDEPAQVKAKMEETAEEAGANTSPEE